MNITWLGPNRLTDTSMDFINTILQILSYSDPSFSAKLVKNVDKLIVHLTPSNPDFREEIISNLLWINKHLHAKIVFSSSLAISKLISFTIPTLEKL